jgi:hypothetical protein
VPSIEEVNHDRQDHAMAERPTPGRAVMMSKRLAAVIALTVSAMLLISSPAYALGWTTVPSPSDVPGDNYLYGADSSDATNVWAVGVVYPPTGGNFHGLALRYNGTAWSSVSRTGLPGNETLHGVRAISATDVWAVGDQSAGIGHANTLAAHWNGTAWTPEATPNGNASVFNHLYGVAAAGGTVWAVGTYVDPNSSNNRLKLILQRTGGSWHVSAAPKVATYESLAAVDATGSTDAWAVGSATSDIQSAPQVPLALHWNGTSWVSATVPAPGGTALAGVDERTSSDVWAVGSSSDSSGGSQPFVAHFDGTSWHSIAPPTIAGGGQLTDVVALSASNVVAVGRSNGSPLILRWNGSAWTRDSTPAFSNPYLTGAAASGSNGVWAIGYSFNLNAYANRTLTMLGS